LLNKIKTVNGYSPAAVSKLEEVEKKKAQRLRYSLSAFCCLHFVCHYHLHLNIPA